MSVLVDANLNSGQRAKEISDAIRRQDPKFMRLLGETAGVIEPTPLPRRWYDARYETAH
jgi:hypothetical protein